MTSPIAPDLPAAGRMPVKPRAGVWRRLVKRRLALLGLVDRRHRRRRRHPGAMADRLRSERADVRRADARRRAAAAERQILAGHRPARPRPADPHPLWRPHLADHRHRRQWRGAVDRHAGRRHRRLFPRLDRQRADALHRSDDGVSGAAARHLPGGGVRAEPVDRRHGDRAGQLGADRARHLHRDQLARRTRVHRCRAHHRRERAAHPVSPHPAASSADHHRLGHARHLDHGAAGGDALLSSASACSRRPRPGATSSSRTRPISRPHPGWCSSRAPRSWRWRWPST